MVYTKNISALLGLRIRRITGITSHHRNFESEMDSPLDSRGTINTLKFKGSCVLRPSPKDKIGTFASDTRSAKSLCSSKSFSQPVNIDGD